MTAVVIIGFGLIGGSIASALRQRHAAPRIVAVDLPSVIASDAVRALSDQRIAIDAGAELDAALRGSEVAVLAAPVSIIQRELGRALDLAPIVTDCGSTKRVIVEGSRAHPRADRFVPGHPLAGSSQGGASAARPDLFEGKPWILCPQGADADALARVRALVQGLGAVAVEMGAEDHDRAVALTSHAPQLLASALFALSRSRNARAAEGPGFITTTRIAGGNPAVWRDIFRTNADEIARALRDLGHTLTTIASDLERDPPEVDSAVALLESARALRSERSE